MKLLRWGPVGLEKPGMLGSDGQRRDLSMLLPEIGPAQLSPRTLAALALLDVDKLPVVPLAERHGAPFAGTGKIVCVGLNYADHAAEAGLALPPEPVLFLKPSSAICGPYDDVIIPRASVKTDWEVELGVVIGSKAQDVSEARALDHVAGYTIVNDISEREFQLERSGQWDKGKGCDTFAPLGPWLVTPDEIAAPQDLRLWLEVNGQRVQDSSTRQLAFGVAALVSYISRFMSLQPGDVISTGTPPGVGLGQKPAPWFLKAGDRMRLGIQGLGQQAQCCVPAGDLALHDA